MLLDTQTPGSGIPKPIKILVVLAVVVFGGLLVLGVGAALLLPGLTRARMSGNETSAIGSLRAIVSAQLTYAATVCGGRYSARLATLAAANVISPDLAMDPTTKNGYVISLVRPPESQEDAGTEAGCVGLDRFRATAVPVAPGETGARYFITDETGVVREATNAEFDDARPVS